MRRAVLADPDQGMLPEGAEAIGALAVNHILPVRALSAGRSMPGYRARSADEERAELLRPASTASISSARIWTNAVESASALVA